MTDLQVTATEARSRQCVSNSQISCSHDHVCRWWEHMDRNVCGRPKFGISYVALKKHIHKGLKIMEMWRVCFQTEQWYVDMAHRCITLNVSCRQQKCNYAKNHLVLLIYADLNVNMVIYVSVRWHNRTFINRLESLASIQSYLICLFWCIYSVFPRKSQRLRLH